MSTEIYYITGSGNSLHVARELQRRIPETRLIPMVRLLGEDAVETAAETVGFVFPIRLTMAPAPVGDLVQKLDLAGAGYLFAVATRASTSHGAFADIGRSLRRKGRRLDAHFTLTMANNDPKFGYRVPARDEMAAWEAALQPRLDAIQRTIVGRETSRERDTEAVARIPNVLLRLIRVAMGLAERAGLEDSFYADSRCRGCGTCERVCLSQKIRMSDQGPVWQKGVTCFRCYACINYCPAQAIQIRRFTEENERYPHPYATVDDIAAQKGV